MRHLPWRVLRIRERIQIHDRRADGGRDMNPACIIGNQWTHRPTVEGENDVRAEAMSTAMPCGIGRHPDAILFHGYCGCCQTSQLFTYYILNYVACQSQGTQV